MFKIFSFRFGDNFRNGNIDNINGSINSIFNNMGISEIVEKYIDTFSDIRKEEEDSLEDDFIKINEYEDMYLLTIDIRGIDLRELSIRYDFGIIEINLFRSEIEKSMWGILRKDVIVKKPYNKKFEDIEDIDTNQILKNIDNGILSIRMQKKYSLTSSIVDVDSYVEN